MAVAPNLHEEIRIDQKEIQGFFTLLDYPYTIRSDAITAVGAPSSIGFLMRALYWLYLCVKMLCHKPDCFQIVEQSSEMSESSKEVEMKEESKESPEDMSLFSDILSTAWQQLRLFEEPYQLKFKLANQLALPENDPLRELLMFEYQNFLHGSLQSPPLQQEKRVRDFIAGESLDADLQGSRYLSIWQKVCSIAYLQS